MIINGQVYRDDQHPTWCLCDECVAKDETKEAFTDSFDDQPMNYCPKCDNYYRHDQRFIHEAIHRKLAEELPKVKVPVARTGPPTERMIERVQELKDHELFTEYEWLRGCIVDSKMLNTQGACGKLISEMKKKINAKGGNV